MWFASVHVVESSAILAREREADARTRSPSDIGVGNVVGFHIENVSVMQIVIAHCAVYNLHFTSSMPLIQTVSMPAPLKTEAFHRDRPSQPQITVEDE